MTDDKVVKRALAVHDRIFSSEPVMAVLRGQLLVETALNGLLRAAATNADSYNFERASFATKVDLARAFAGLDDGMAALLRAINKLRNRLAHEYTSHHTTLDDLKAFNSVDHGNPVRGFAIHCATIVVTLEQEGEELASRRELERTILRKVAVAVTAELADIEAGLMPDPWAENDDDQA